jgi:hypothetical protein
MPSIHRQTMMSLMIRGTLLLHWDIPIPIYINNIIITTAINTTSADDGTTTTVNTVVQTVLLIKIITVLK